MEYNHLEVEKKWQEYWEKNKSFKSLENSDKEKLYVLDMFPYPSGAGLHVGHPEGYTATDIYSRAKRMQGYNVLHPMGWDAFGLPAEQFAIKTGNHPKGFTQANIDIFKRQIKSFGFSYDWDREVDSTDPEFYKWTQWIFIQLYNKGLAEVQDIEVNWCPELGTVLANEEVINEDGKMFSDIGHFPVVKKPMSQWVLKITEYAERLLNDLKYVNWPESIIEMQKNWIGKSEGANFHFKIDGFDNTIEVYSTRPDTIYGATYMVLSPEHSLVNKITSESQRKDVEEYQNNAKSKSDLERTDLNKDKTGVFTGAYAINPVNNKKIPIWISDYVLISYGTGAIMAVPAHDDRDYEFAKKFDLEIISVIEGADVSEKAYLEDGKHINSDIINGLETKEAIDKIIEYLENNNLGNRQVNYKIRDWLFARQRYWGEPFPVIHWEDGTIEVVSDDELPIELPELEDFKPTGTGESPLAKAKEWLEVVRADGVKGKRDTNTMPQWAGSSWYFIAFILKSENGYLDLSDPKNHKLINEWMPVDLYVGGAEHAVLHLLYSRFWHKVLFDCGILDYEEPFQRLFNQGMILGENGVKMSKSLGNVINPDDIIKTHGADSLRLYEMFMGPLDQRKAWSTNSLDGARRFIDRVYRLISKDNIASDINDGSLDLVYNKTIKKVTKDYDALHFNTAISQMMIFVNEAYKSDKVYKPYLDGFVQVFSCICPHIGAELWQMLGNESDLTYQEWPKYDEALIQEDVVTIVVQINGKLRARLDVELNADEQLVKDLALKNENVKNHLQNKEIVKEIFVKNKLYNIVVK